MRGRDGFLPFQRAVAPVLAGLRARSGMAWQVLDGATDADAVEADIAAHVDAWLACSSS
jgi:hypothetical protein